MSFGGLLKNSIEEGGNEAIRIFNNLINNLGLLEVTLASVEFT